MSNEVWAPCQRLWVMASYLTVLIYSIPRLTDLLAVCLTSLPVVMGLAFLAEAVSLTFRFRAGAVLSSLGHGKCLRDGIAVIGDKIYTDLSLTLLCHNMVAMGDEISAWFEGPIVELKVQMTRL